NHLPLRRVRILAERFCMIGRNFLSYEKEPTPDIRRCRFARRFSLYFLEKYTCQKTRLSN
ncbi:hypothetical protein AAAY25_13910, partial [Brotaphodocola catenula]|uniref:hypothetical protein n=1 Tax=Brotaphodocola catenula TaxID=2885361 RepID=UPI0032C12286